MQWAFAPGGRVLELNCGTGEDAVALACRGVHVVATDASAAMVAATRAKADAAGVGQFVATRLLTIEQAASADGPFDGVLSNFGGLNCVTDLGAAAHAIASVVRPGGRAVLCIMGPVVPWEWAWFLGHGQPGKAVRRLRRSVEWRGLEVRYPSVGRAVRAFAPDFTLHRRWGAGVALPPPYTEPWAARHTGLVGTLDRIDRRIEAWPGAAALADHYVLELVRR